ncbi:hypothetical protein SLEP1_g27104 [Rubroshorea leprosula]|uniref:Uncharacterized protein n=1 Tax=Rubroshorea leprosula TaxID=152421 RepID=A0AAV5JP62_9ROSI|nr:hypothetical protein SLEP1_g27104 [Rubroshorea leprosula]
MVRMENSASFSFPRPFQFLSRTGESFFNHSQLPSSHCRSPQPSLPLFFLLSQTLLAQLFSVLPSSFPVEMVNK